MLDLLKKQWQQSSAAKKVGFAAGIGLLVVMVVLAGYWTLKDDYQVLFSDLSNQDAAVMVSELDRLKVPYKLADNGTTILVDREAVYKTRLKLMAGKGLNLNGSVGFEIFNNAEFGMTEFAQKVNYQRALQGELARTIMAFDEVKAARVHLVLPESGLFKRQTAKPKASVSVQLKDGNVLSHEQVSGIQRLVAASVPEISPSEVTVVDHRGVAVTKLMTGDQPEAVLHDRLDVKKQLEDYMIRKIVRVVDRAVGPGKAIVSVDVALNYDQLKITKEDIVPLPETSGQDVGAVVRRKESIQANDSWESSNSAQGKANASWTPNSSQTETEYINSKRVEQVLSAQGNVVKLNVGVLVPQMEDKVQLAKLKEMIAMVAGIDSTRGDGLVVYGIDSLQSSPAPDQAPPIETVLTSPSGDQTAMADKKLKKTSSYDMWWLVGLFLVITTILVLLSQRQQESNKSRLTQEQKDQLLAELSEWASHAKRI